MTERQIRRREDILAAARHLISEKGYEGVNMRDLARESGVAPKTLYHQFENKEKLLRTAVEERFRYIYQMIDEVQLDTGVDRLFHIVDSVSAITNENAAYAQALAPLFGSDDRSTFSLICMRTYHRAIEQIAADGDLHEWVDVDLFCAALFRQMKAIYRASWMNRTSGDMPVNEAKLDICLMVAGVSKGNTRKRVIAMAGELQGELAALR